MDACLEVMTLNLEALYLILVWKGLNVGISDHGKSLWLNML